MRGLSFFLSASESASAFEENVRKRGILVLVKLRWKNHFHLNSNDPKLTLIRVV